MPWKEPESLFTTRLEKSFTIMSCLSPLYRKRMPNSKRNSRIVVAQTSLMEVNASLNSQVQLASDKLKKQGCNMPPLKRSAERPYSESHLCRLKKQRLNDCELSLAWLERQGFKATKVEALNKETGKNLKYKFVCTCNFKCCL